MADRNEDIKDDPFDIRDESMEIDDAVLGDENLDPPIDTASDEDADNWQSAIVAQAIERKLPQELIEKLKGQNAVDEIISAIANKVQQTPIVREEQARPARIEQDETLDLDIDEATAFDPDAVRAMKKMQGHFENRIKQLEGRLRGAEDADESAKVSSFVDSLGTEWNSVFGTKDKPNAENIRKLQDAVETIRAGFTARHKRIPSQEDLVRMALSAEFADKHQEVARNQIASKVAKRASQFVSRPGTRTAKSANPRMRAAQGVADWFRSKGIDPYAGGNDNFE